MKYEIQGEPMPVVICHLEGGESMITERGSMVWMSPNMKMETGAGGLGKAFGRMFSGDSIFQNTYTAQGGPGMIAFASSFPGAIRAVEIDPAHPVVVQKSGFLASEEGVELSIFFQKKMGAGFFGGEGFIMQKLSGSGTAFVELDGSVVEYDLQPGQGPAGADDPPQAIQNGAHTRDVVCRQDGRAIGVQHALLFHRVDAQTVGDAVHVGAEHQRSVQVALPDADDVAAFSAESIAGVVGMNGEADILQLGSELFSNLGLLSGGGVGGDQFQQLLVHF